MRRSFDLRRTMQKRVQLQGSQVRSPCQSRKIVNQNVIDGGSGFATRHGKGFHPLRCKTRGVLLIECLSVNTIGVPLQRHWPIAKMRQQELSNFAVVFDDIGFRKFGRRIKNLL